MQKYDLTPINEQLKKEIKGNEENLKAATEDLIAKFKDYESEVVKLSNLSLLTDKEVERLRESVESFTKAFELLKQVLGSEASAVEKIEMLKKVIQL